MNFHEFAMLFVNYLMFSSGGNDVALVVKKADLTPLGWAHDSRQEDELADTCIVRALQAKSESNDLGGTCYVYSTSKPTLMCIGMGVRCAVNKFFFIEHDRLLSLTPKDTSLDKPTDETDGTRTPVPIPPDWDPKVLPSVLSEDSLRHRLDIPHGLSIGSLYYYINILSEVDIRAALDELKKTPANQWIEVAHARKLPQFTGPTFAAIPSSNFIPGRPSSPLQHRIYMSIAFALLDWALRRAPTSCLGKHIACLLVDPNGIIISWAFNTNGANATLHAEVNCVQNYVRISGAKIPDGCTLYTTLQSCEMCSGMLVTCARELKVIYGTTDKALRGTVLTGQQNRCSEEKYSEPLGNPLARANLQRLVSKYQLVAKYREGLSGNNGNPKLAARYRDEFEQSPEYSSTHSRSPLRRFNVELDKAATNALDQPNVVEIIHGYHFDFLELGRNILSNLSVLEHEPNHSESIQGSKETASLLGGTNATEHDLMAWYNGFLLLNSIRKGSLFMPT